MSAPRETGRPPPPHPLAGVMPSIPIPPPDSGPAHTPMHAIPKPCQYNTLATAVTNCTNPNCPYARFHAKA